MGRGWRVRIDGWSEVGHMEAFFQAISLWVFFLGFLLVYVLRRRARVFWSYFPFVTLDGWMEVWCCGTLCSSLFVDFLVLY